MSDTFQPVWWEAGVVCLIDQRLLPAQEQIVRCTTLDAVINAIRTMQVRGAPAIGCTSAYGLALIAQQSIVPNSSAAHTAAMLTNLEHAKTLLDAARPTAVNLSWATKRVLDSTRRYLDETTINATESATTAEAAAHVLDEAHAILAEDRAMCYAIGQHGVGLIPQGGRVLTHCNAGGLATAGYGTALAPIRLAHEQGRPIHVLVDETRPFLQGARLTAWELERVGVPLTLITDSMAGYFMRRGEVDCVIVGADRVVANGDIANKIGTYSLAVLAHAHGIPFYVAAPSSTVDFTLPNGDAIPIEQRDSAEVTALNGVPIAPPNVKAAHPAFDVTPHTLISAIITERGIVEPPYDVHLRQLLAEN
jgi:methylthioribose-1-phosphate isomerase